MKYSFTVGLVALLFTAPVLYAQSENNCHRFSADLERLSCYDDQTGFAAIPSGASPEEDAGGASGEQWSYGQDVSALDGRTDVWLSVRSSNYQPNQIGRAETAELWIQCIQNTTSLGVTFNDYTSENQMVRYRLDGQGVDSVRMRPAAGGEGLGLWSGAEAIPFIRGMMDASELVIGYQSYSNSRLEFSFDISGLPARIEPLADACGWQS